MRRLILLALFSLGLSPLAATAQTGSVWKTKCDENACTASQELLREGTNQVFSFMFAKEFRGKDLSRIGVILPLGIAVIPNVVLRVGDTDFKLPITVCLQTGCQAERDFSDAELRDLASTGKVDVLFVPFGQRRPVAASMVTTGLPSLLKEYRAKLN